MNTPKISVIISTYNSEEWLQKVLWGYSIQTYKDFEVLIADDGSREETKQLIESFKANYPVPVTHVWHEDKGYRRQKVLNETILKTNYEYVLFTDGDCIPKSDFVEAHAKYAEKGRFLSGGYCKLNMEMSKMITEEDILSENCFDIKWLKKRSDIGFSQTLKIASGDFSASMLDAVTPTGATFNNCNSSAWKQDLIDINGYDERMQYGGSDREIGERLTNFGVKGKQIRHRAICLHLDHSRGYKTSDSIQKNLAIRKETKDKNIKRTTHGIVKAF
ncbi:MAG: glycosyltransferase family 2 protein [Flavobacteriaceae bacterium]|nr:glycosyltransferase family 2 protein [Flavobacteriaceae bacterium]